MNTIDNKPAPVISMWAIYCHPSDFPNDYVVRRWDLDHETGQGRPAPEASLAPTLAQARDLVPFGRICLHRYEQDDPAIVEVWI